MGCGCKKAAKLSEPIKQPAQITMSVEQVQPTTEQIIPNLNEQQQQIVDNIIDKLKQIGQ